MRDTIKRVCEAINHESKSDLQLHLSEYRMLGGFGGLPFDLGWRIPGEVDWWLCFVPHIVDEWQYTQPSRVQEVQTEYFIGTKDGRFYNITVDIASYDTEHIGPAIRDGDKELFKRLLEEAARVAGEELRRYQR